MSFVLEALKSVKRDISEPFGYQIINYGGDSLPLGGSGKIKPYRRQTLLKRGDTVIMTTDGA